MNTYEIIENNISHYIEADSLTFDEKTGQKLFHRNNGAVKWELVGVAKAEATVRITKKISENKAGVFEPGF